MKIARIEVYKSPIALRIPFKTSLGVQPCAENIMVRITTDDGLAGYGECSPFTAINGENMETGFAVAQLLAKNLLGADPTAIEACSGLMDRVIFANTSIKSAIDIALYDLAAQAAGLPLYRYLNGRRDRELITDYTVSLGDPDTMAEDARKILERGFQVIKVKVGRSGREDVERIRRIRESVGDAVPIRIDANQGWEADEAIAALNGMKNFNIEFCEEPIPRWNFMELSKVRKQSPIPVMADECCLDHHDAQRLIDLSACDMINVKLGKSSGIFKALKIIRIAEKHGLPMQIGGFLESRLAFTASAHLALTSDSIAYCDFDTPLMLTADPVIGGITYGEKGKVSIPEGIGLGASVDEDYLKTLEKAEVRK